MKSEVTGHNTNLHLVGLHCADLVLIVEPQISLWRLSVTKWKKSLEVTEVDEIRSSHAESAQLLS